MFSCSLCREQSSEYVFIQSHCSTCEQIRRIISLYDKDKILETLRTVYLREELPIDNRTKKIIEEKTNKSDDDSTYNLRKSPKRYPHPKQVKLDDVKVA